MSQYRHRTFAGLVAAFGLTAAVVPAYAGFETTTTTTLVKPTTTTLVKPTTTTTVKATTTTTLKVTTTTTLKGTTTTTVKPTTTTTMKVTTTTTTKPSTTTTTMPSTTTTTEPTTTTTAPTTTTLASTTTTAASTTTLASTTTIATTTTTTFSDTTTTTVPKEICGDCIDNDGDGLVDFDDPDCCGSNTQIVLKRYQIRPRQDDDTTLTRVRSCLPLPDKDLINPFVQDLYVQMKDEKSGTFFCAVINHEKFMKMHHYAITYWDRGATKNPMAKGITDVAFFKRKCTGFYLFGPHVQYLADQESGYNLTIGLQNPFVPENNVCATTKTDMVRGRPLQTPGSH